MPFVTQDHRENPDISIPGDRCYQYYKQLVDEWKQNPGWTTAHSLYRRIRHETFADPSAAELAWQVFFYKYVIPYENLKEKENGTI